MHQNWGNAVYNFFSAVFFFTLCIHSSESDSDEMAKPSQL